MRTVVRVGGRHLVALAIVLLAAPTLAVPAGATPRPGPADSLPRQIVDSTANDPPATDSPTTVPQAVIVSLDPAAPPVTRALLRATRPSSSTAAVEFAHGTGYAATLSTAAIEALRATPGVLAVTPNRVLEPHAAPQLEQTGAPSAWAGGWRGDGQAIVIIDTGVDATNPNLAGKVVAEACFTPARGAGGDCPDGSAAQIAPGAAAPCTGRADCAHGTHVASTAVANGPTVYGTAPGAAVIAVRVFTSVTDPSERIVTDEGALIRALEWVDALRSSQPVAAVNMSLGGGPIDTPCTASPALAALIGRLTADGIAIVASAGNDASSSGLSFPASAADVLSAGAEGRVGLAASFTNAAGSIDFFAPGEAVEGAWSAPCCTRVLSGTSFAAPQVAAAFALLRQQLGPGPLDPRIELLRRTGDPVYVPVAVGWSAATALRVGRALDPQFHAAAPAALPRRTSPIGSFDALRVDPSGLRVSGWSIDPDTAGPVTVHVYVDGAFAATTVAARWRPDVGDAFAGFGSAHGFEAVLAVGPGDHTVCTYALDLGAGSGNVLLACRSASYGNAIGALDSALGAAGSITVTGWAIDTTRAASVAVELVVDDVVVARRQAAAPRTDVAATYVGYGAEHGYVLSAFAAPGVHRVCVRVATSSPGVSGTIGCRDVVVPSGGPFGVVDALLVSARTVTAHGWAIDPDTMRSITVAIRLDGVVVTTAGADRDRPDLLSGAPGYGASHGFSVTVPAAPGAHRVCVEAVDAESGALDPLSCVEIDVP